MVCAQPSNFRMDEYIKMKAYWDWRMMYEIMSVKHCLNFIIKGLVVQIVDLDGLEVLLGVEVSLSNQKGLPEHNLFDFGIIVVHDIVVDVSFLFAHLEETGHLLRCQLLALVGCGFVVHHLVQLRQGFRVVFICMRRGVHF